MGKYNGRKKLVLYDGNSNDYPKTNFNFLSARSPSGRAETESQNYVGMCMDGWLGVGSAVISSSSSSSVSVEEGSSRTCVGVSP